jgi:polyisoprenoid-binding protein YceI
MASAIQALLADGKLAGAWTLDGARSSVGLSSKSMWNLAKVNGRFTQVTGAGVITAGGEATGTITVAAASIETGIKKRDDHLRSKDFFDVAKYPDISVNVTSAAPSGDGGDGGDAVFAGTLTIRDRTRPVTVNGKVSAVGDEVTVDAEVPVNRGDYGMSFNRLGMMSLHNIITIHAVFTRA